MTTDTSTRPRYGTPAAITALALLLVAFIISVIDGVVGVVYTQGQTLESLEGFDYALPALGWAVPFAVWQLVPLSVGVFLSFWLLLPIRPQHGVSGAIVRSLVALLIGLVLATIVAAVRLLASDLPVGPSQDPDDNRFYILVIGGVANSAWQLFAATAGLVLAAGLTLWGWLRTRATPGPLRRESPETLPVPSALEG